MFAKVICNCDDYIMNVITTSLNCECMSARVILIHAQTHTTDTTDSRTDLVDGVLLVGIWHDHPVVLSTL